MSSLAKRVGIAILGLVLAASVVAGQPSPANATAQTCIGATGGYVCTIVYGSGTRVDSVGVSRGKGGSIGMCGTSAWFYYIPPSGGAYGLASVSRDGCVWGRAWFDIGVNRTFPRGTQLCAKFYENYWQNFIAQKCVGVS